MIRKLLELEGEMNKLMIIVRYCNTLLSEISRKRKQEITTSLKT